MKEYESKQERDRRLNTVIFKYKDIVGQVHISNNYVSAATPTDHVPFIDLYQTESTKKEKNRKEELGLVYLPRYDIFMVQYTSPDFICTDLDLGYANLRQLARKKGTDSIFVCRNPARIALEGVSRNGLVGVKNKNKINLNNYSYSGIVDMILGNYPSLSQVKERILAGDTRGIAVSKNVAYDLSLLPESIVLVHKDVPFAIKQLGSSSPTVVLQPKKLRYIKNSDVYLDLVNSL